jgi:hypothetical protein
LLGFNPTPKQSVFTTNKANAPLPSGRLDNLTGEGRTRSMTSTDGRGWDEKMLQSSTLSKILHSGHKAFTNPALHIVRI